jgi:hypothetical protein
MGDCLQAPFHPVGPPAIRRRGAGPGAHPGPRQAAVEDTLTLRPAGGGYRIELLR